MAGSRVASGTVRLTTGSNRRTCDLANAPIRVVVGARRTIRESTQVSLARSVLANEAFTHIKSCFASADVREAMAAFKETRMRNAHARQLVVGRPGL